MKPSGRQSSPGAISTATTRPLRSRWPSSVDPFAQKYFGAANPLGQHFRIRDGRGPQFAWSITGGPVEIVGVVKDAKYGSLRDEPSPFVFIPWSQGGVPGPLTSFELRPAGGAPTALISGVKSAIGNVNRDVSIEFETLAAKVDDSILRERLLATLSGFFGGLALLLATIGLYGVMSYNVARRRNEIGIRMALGAEQSRVLRMVLGEVAISYRRRPAHWSEARRWPRRASSRRSSMESTRTIPGRCRWRAEY